MAWNREINAVLERVFEGGFYHYYLRKYIDTSILDVRIEKVPSSVFEIEHVEGPFYILILGLLCALAVAGFEMLLGRKRSSRGSR